MSVSKEFKIYTVRMKIKATANPGQSPVKRMGEMLNRVFARAGLASPILEGSVEIIEEEPVEEKE